MKQMDLPVNRVENKYLLSIPRAVALATHLNALLLADVHNGVDGYHVKSVYFDNYSDTNYFDKLSGEYERKVIRIRRYNNDDNAIFLECKHKRGCDQRKSSLSISRNEANSILEGEYDCLSDFDNPLRAFFYREFSLGLVPVSTIAYKRNAFYWPEDKTRVTIDRDIRYSDICKDLFGDDCALMPLLSDYNAVLEVKQHGRLKKHLRTLLRGYCDIKLAFSKYANSRITLQY